MGAVAIIATVVTAAYLAVLILKRGWLRAVLSTCILLSLLIITSWGLYWEARRSYLPEVNRNLLIPCEELLVRLHSLSRSQRYVDVVDLLGRYDDLFVVHRAPETVRDLRVLGWKIAALAKLDAAPDTLDDVRRIRNDGRSARHQSTFPVAKKLWARHQIAVSALAIPLLIALFIYMVVRVRGAVKRLAASVILSLVIFLVSAHATLEFAAKRTLRDVAVHAWQPYNVLMRHLQKLAESSRQEEIDRLLDAVLSADEARRVTILDDISRRRNPRFRAFIDDLDLDGEARGD